MHDFRYSRVARIERGYVLLLCVAGLAGSLGAQSDKPEQTTVAEVATHEAPATFKSRVNLVLVPVVVRDKQGQPVGNLTKEDFELFDKGKPQTITRFTVEKGGTTGTKPPVAAQTGTSKPGEEPPAVQGPERFVGYLFDDMHLTTGDLMQARQAANRHISELGATERAAIFTTSGRTSLDFTDDRAKLMQILSQLQPRPMSSSPGTECPDISYYQADLIKNKNDRDALDTATADALGCMKLDPKFIDMARQAAQATASRMVAVGEQETHLSLQVLREAVRRMSVMPGQRILVLVSPGFLISYARPEELEVMDRAIHANVTINTLDARGLYTDPVADASRRASYDSNTTSRMIQYVRDAAFQQADVLAELSDGTGGIFFHNSNDLGEGFKRAGSRPEYIYLMGFSPQNLKSDGSFHSLKVTLKTGKGLTLQARRGYFAPKHEADAAEDAKREIEEALFSREEIHDIPLQLHTQFFKTTEVDAKLSILARVDVRQLRFRKAEGRNQDDLTVVSGLFDRNGNYISGNQKVIAMRLKDDTLERRLAGGITVKTSFDVKPGAYVIRLVIRDAEGQLMAAQNGAIEIP